METDLSKSDLLTILDIIQSSLECKDAGEFTGLLDQVKDLINFSYARCGFGDFKEFEAESMAAFKMVSAFPEAWEKRYAEENYILKDAVARAAYQNKGLLYWSDCLKIVAAEKNSEPVKILEEAASIGLNEGWIYSLQGRRSSECAIISLGGEHLKKDGRTEKILDHLGPHLGGAIKRIILGQAKPPASLTSREHEILSWAAAGKSAWEISRILKISQRTVEFHMGNILNKLDAVNAQQALAIAVSTGLIDY